MLAYPESECARSPGTMIAANKNMAAIRILLDEGGLRNAVSSTEWQNILVRAARAANPNLVCHLVAEKMGDVRLPGEYGKTALEYLKGEWESPQTTDMVHCLLAHHGEGGKDL